MQELHDTSKRHVATCRFVADRLDCLSNSAHDMGLDRLAQQLDDMCDQLRAATDELGKAVANAIYQRATDAEQATTNMMAAVLAVLPTPPAA